MSFVATAPDLLTTAAKDLTDIGSTLREATTVASAPTTALAAAAADEVSDAVSQLFASFGREFQAVNTQAAAFHAEFVQLLSGSAAQYLNAEITNAATTLANTPVQSLLAGGPAATTVPGGAYGQLVINTATNLQTLGNAWSADPFPLLRQIVVNQQGYAKQIGATFAAAIQSFPANLANLPAGIEASVQQLITFPAASYIQQFVATQLGFAQTAATAANHGITGLVAGLPAFGTGLQTTFQTLLTGNYTGALDDLGRAFANLLVTGIYPGPVTVIVDLTHLTLTASLYPKLLGPLGDLFTIMNLPGQEAQYLTNLMPPSILRQMSQNFTNAVNTLTLPSISVLLTQPLTATGSLAANFGIPLALTYAAAGAPFSALNALATSAETIGHAVSTGNPLGAVAAVIDAPANALNGFLNGDNAFDTLIQVPTNLPVGYPQDVTITLHLPVDGILVPPQPVTATVDPHLPQFVSPFDVTILGTPFPGLVPLLVNYLPQQLAAAITPA
ncbi:MULTISPECIES: PE family protein [Mycobacterium]|uniref:PE family protein n=1 Tax=Mycobacterium kiyosense TaxID=2871094 RepID=A0A9P3Q9Y7_9MYCO|nr:MULTISPECIES: PE family protein [Mycobacterium]BDE11329.1 PE family protein [Mycobacterium sp. 20KCMC460]GLB86260.1 PE family protein [Mycobacterium kiyosense]GLB92857.1 PE family protein [Mycobacterium kiyosense]GLB98931.1 PE family protein [Mycobacterium kiyosense]GLC05085.1 PE family protein [Mycobacterium kiyosense]